MLWEANEGSAVPAGLGQCATRVPALKRRAILECPSGTGRGVSDSAAWVPEGRLAIAHGLRRGSMEQNNQAPQGRLNCFTRAVSAVPAGLR